MAHIDELVRSLYRSNLSQVQIDNLATSIELGDVSKDDYYHIIDNYSGTVVSRNAHIVLNRLREITRYKQNDYKENNYYHLPAPTEKSNYGTSPSKSTN